LVSNTAPSPFKFTCLFILLSNRRTRKREAGGGRWWTWRPRRIDWWLLSLVFMHAVVCQSPFCLALDVDYARHV